MDSHEHDPLTEIARAVRPLLNRIVFTGIHVSRFHHRAGRERIRQASGASTTVPGIATVALDRLAPELVACGLERVQRVQRGNGQEKWRLPSRGHLALVAGDANTGDAGAIAREYAVLLTRSVSLAADLSVRVTVPAIQLALSWADHRESQAAVTESASVEDMLEIVACHAGIIADIEALPGELRESVAQAARELAAHDACAWVLRRALPDSRLAPGIVHQIHDRLHRIAALGTAKGA